MGVDGDILGAAHHTIADQTEAELVFDIHADLDGRQSYRPVHNVLVHENQHESGDERDTQVMRQSQVYNIRHLPDENRLAVDAVLQAGKPESPAAHVLRVHTHLDAHRLPDYHRDTDNCQILQIKILHRIL